MIMISYLIPNPDRDRTGIVHLERTVLVDTFEVE